MAPIKKKVPKANDVIVGTNVRRLRLMRRISQEKLGDELGLTFQQVQKYEKGTNRMGSSRLMEIAGVLNCSIEDLFEGVIIKRNGKEKTPPNDPMRALGSTRHGIRIANAVLCLPDNLQRAIAGLCEDLAEAER